jgi:uncharacterized membrane protein YhaH (DUF805 family)
MRIFGDPIFRLKFTGASMLLSSINLVNLRTKILCSSSHVVLHTVTRNSLCLVCLVCLICLICLALAAALKVKRSKDKKKATTTLVVFLSRKQWMECHGDSSGSLSFPFLSLPFCFSISVCFRAAWSRWRSCLWPSSKTVSFWESCGESDQGGWRSWLGPLLAGRLVAMATEKWGTWWIDGSA